MNNKPPKLLITNECLTQLDENVCQWSGYSNVNNFKNLLGLLEDNSDYYRKQLQTIIAHILEQAQKKN